MNPPKGVIAGCRAQHCMPLADLDRGCQSCASGQDVVFVIEQACRLVRALDIAPEPVKAPGLIAIEGALGDPCEGLAGLLYLAEQSRQIAGQQLPAVDGYDAIVGDI